MNLLAAAATPLLRRIRRSGTVSVAVSIEEKSTTSISLARAI